MIYTYGIKNGYSEIKGQSMIVIADYGMGNLHSVKKGLENVGADVFVSSDPAEIIKAEAIVLPGVGAYDDACIRLKETGVAEAILKAAEADKPLLGICLGMQLLFEGSEEGKEQGLGILPGKILRFPDTMKVPHMGWNRVQTSECPLYNGIDGFYAYFVHSFYAPYDESYSVSKTAYSADFASTVRKGNMYATQFHPEKSGTMGIKVLENFAAIAAGKR